MTGKVSKDPKDEDVKNSPPNINCPDGGWGWVIDGPTFATFWFQNTKPTATLLPSLLKCCIENKANCRQSRAEINEI